MYRVATYFLYKTDFSHLSLHDRAFRAVKAHSVGKIFLFRWICSMTPFCLLFVNKTRIVRNLTKNLVCFISALWMSPCYVIKLWNFLSSTVIWKCGLTHLLIKGIWALPNRGNPFDRCCLRKTLVSRHAGTSVSPPKFNRGFVAHFLSHVLIKLVISICFLEENSLGWITNCPSMAQVVSKHQAVKNAKLANRQASVDQGFDSWSQLLRKLKIMISRQRIIEFV